MYVKGYVCTIQTSNVACLSYQHQSYQPSCQPMGRRRLSGLVRVGGLLIVLCLANRFPWAQSAAKSAAPVTSTSKDERVLRRYQRHDGWLDGLLKRIKRPRLEFFESGGVKYWLPLSAEDAVVEGCSEDELAYLSGFFDGDGCVACRTDGAIYLQVGQSIKGGNALLRFQRAFGGGIYRQTDGCSTTQPMIYWSLSGVSGTDAARAAKLLSRNSYIKQAQLLVAMSGNVAEDSIPQVKQQLEKRRTTFPRNFSATWSYLAGFFDAEGCIEVPPASNSVHLRVDQKCDAILQALFAFLEAEGLSGWKIYDAADASSLICYMSNVSKQTLRQLLLNGLSLKRDQAQIALQLNASSRGEVRDKLFPLVGQQNRYKRVDRHGMERAEEIARQRGYTQYYKGRNKTKMSLLKEGLQLLREKHKLENLKYTCSLKSSDIRRFLNEGASFMPLKSKKVTACVRKVQLGYFFGPKMVSGTIWDWGAKVAGVSPFEHFPLKSQISPNLVEKHRYAIRIHRVFVWICSSHFWLIEPPWAPISSIIHIIFTSTTGRPGPSCWRVFRLGCATVCAAHPWRRPGRTCGTCSRRKTWGLEVALKISQDSQVGRPTKGHDISINISKFELRMPGCLIISKIFMKPTIWDDDPQFTKLFSHEVPGARPPPAPCFAWRRSHATRRRRGRRRRPNVSFFHGIRWLGGSCSEQVSVCSLWTISINWEASWSY